MAEFLWGECLLNILKTFNWIITENNLILVMQEHAIMGFQSTISTK